MMLWWIFSLALGLFLTLAHHAEIAAGKSTFAVRSQMFFGVLLMVLSLNQLGVFG